MTLTHSQVLKFSKVFLALVAAAVVVAVALTMKRRVTPTAPPLVAVRTDPKAIVESTTGRAVRFNRAHEDIRVEYERQLTYADNSTKLLKVKIIADDRGDGRSFTLTADEGESGKDESGKEEGVISLSGHVTLLEADGFTAETSTATYDKRDDKVRAPGDITFHHNRMSGTGVGLLYDKNIDVLTILDRAVMHMAPNEAGKGAADVSAGHATYARMDHLVEFDGGVHVKRAGQVIDSASAIVYLTDDDQRVTVLELHGNSNIASEAADAGSLQGISGMDVALEYADDGQAIEHAIIGGNALVKLSSGAGKAGREIAANTLDVKLASDGATPIAMMARQNVQLTLPADDTVAARTVKAQTLTATSDPANPSRGLTRAEFTGNVEYREKSAAVERTARAAKLDVGLKAAMAAFDSAQFSGAARFEDAKIVGTASSLKYLADQGTLALSGSEPASPRPHVSNDQIAVDANSIDVVLAGPVLNAKGGVKSVLQPPKKTTDADTAKLPSMLKQDQAVNVTADALKFDGDANKATYDGHAQLFQTETSIRGASITIDSKTGDLSASGSVVTTTVLEQSDKEKTKKQRLPSMATAKAFSYSDKSRRAHYDGDVHFSQAENDLSAATVDLFLKPEGNELERAEAADSGGGLVLREQGRRTTGSKLTYSAADERYDISGAPVSVVDQCGRTTNGRTLTFRKATDTIQIDGNRRVRTQTKNGTKCQ
jgi:lipopolysaccharide export system protein LptA